MSKIGPPSTYTQAVADEIVRQLSEGVPLASICRAEGMPAVRTVSDWTKAHVQFGEAFRQARTDGFDAIAAECLDIVDDARNDWMAREDKDGNAGYEFNGEHVQRSRLRVETRLKLLAKWDRSRYGDHMTLASDPENPIAGKTDEQIQARIAELLAKGKGNA